MNLTVLQTKIRKDFSANLNHLKLLILNTPENTLILAPELALTGYSYDNMDNAVEFSKEAIPALLELSFNRTIAITIITKQNEKYYNTLHIFHKGQIVYTQSKHKIFVLNEEKDYFTPGHQEEIKIIEINGVKIASLICFELRFVELWQQLQGADIILVPAYWGIHRKTAFETLTKALAIANQCFVMCADSINEECTKNSAIISPTGIVVKDELQEYIGKKVKLEEISQIRSQLDVGIRGTT